LGASVAGQCLERGLLDEIVVHLVPVLPGGGVRLYDAAGAGAILLERTAGSDPGRSPTSAGVS
jgi:riboflavin biosynthesis pyrimidine reductase